MVTKNEIQRMESISNIKEDIKILLDDGFNKHDIARYILNPKMRGRN